MKRVGWLLGWSVVVPAIAMAQDKPPAPQRQEKDVKETKEMKERRDQLGRLKFMAGCWQAPLDKDTHVEEIWTAPSDNLMSATTRVLTKNRTTHYEFTRISASDSGLVFAASSDGKAFDEYLLSKLVDEYVVFENLKKTFPQRMIYRLSSDGALIPRNEGEGQQSFEVRMTRMKCPGT